MSKCTCAKDHKKIPKERRYEVIAPQGAKPQEGCAVVKNGHPVYVLDKECPKHGYRWIDEEESTDVANTE